MKPKSILLLVILAATWGSSYLFIKLIVPAIGVPLTMAGRMVTGALFLALVALFAGRFPRLKKYWWQYLVLGALNLVVPNLLIAFSVMRLGASMGSILNAIGPLFTLLIARIWLKEALTAAKLTGLLLSITGVVVLIGWNPVPFNSQAALAIAASVGAAISYGFANVFTRVRFAGRNPMQTSSGQLLGAALLVLPVIYFQASPAVFTTGVLIPLLVLGIVCTALAFILYFKLIDSIGSVNTSLVMILVPVFGVLWSAIFLQERVTIGLVIGLALIVGGLVLVLRPAQFHAPLQ